MKRMGVSKVSNEVLITALGMPKDAVVHGVRMNFETHGIEIKWSSERCPKVVEEDSIPVIPLKGV